jgi:Carboxyl transferase domain
MADKMGMPILTFVDTPGAFAGKQAEELGQGEAIAVNLREMFGMRVPIVSVVIGEGGSGGALAIGIANKSLILENAVYYVASPEARNRPSRAVQPRRCMRAACCFLTAACILLPEMPPVDCTSFRFADIWRAWRRRARRSSGRAATIRRRRRRRCASRAPTSWASA